MQLYIIFFLCFLRISKGTEEYANLQLYLWNGTVLTFEKCAMFSEKSQRSDSIHGSLASLAVSEMKNGSCNTNFESPTSGMWVALMPRKGCSFTQMISDAVKRGARAVIVWAQKPHGELIEMLDVDVDLTSHTAVYVNRSFGEFLKNQTELAARANLTLPKVTLIPHVVMEHGGAGSGSSVLFVCVSFIVLMCIALAWLIFYYVQRFHTAHKLDREKRYLFRAAAKALSQMKTRKLKAADPELGSDCTCAVCLDGYKEGETLRTLSCSHSFHKQCVDPWLLERRSCPMCKTDILQGMQPQLIARGMARISSRSVATSLRDALFSPSLDLFTSSRGAGTFLNRTGAERAMYAAEYAADVEDVTLPLQSTSGEPELRRNSPTPSSDESQSGDDVYVHAL